MVAAWKAAGVRRVIIRASTEKPSLIEIAQQQIGACLAGGLPVDAYVWLYWGRQRAAVQFEKALAIYQGFPIERWWLDCEEKTGRLKSATVIKQLLAAAELLGPGRVGIYTRRSFWLSATNNSSALSHLELWDSQPDGEPSMDNFQTYGGWIQPAGKQYQFEVVLGGVAVDLDVFWMGVP